MTAFSFLQRRAASRRPGDRNVRKATILQLLGLFALAILITNAGLTAAGPIAGSGNDSTIERLDGPDRDGDLGGVDIAAVVVVTPHLPDAGLFSFEMPAPTRAIRPDSFLVPYSNGPPTAA